MKLHQILNQMNESSLYDALIKCCGSQRWAEGMLSNRPYKSENHVFDLAEKVWASLNKEDYLEAFKHHPQIGASLDGLRKKFQTTASWSENEQSGVKNANEDTLKRLAKGNKDYVDKFGYIFIVCATGKSANEMLELLEMRMTSTVDEEMNNAANEQSKITAIRLEKLKS